MLRLREDMVALRTSADHMEEKLKAEILFLKEQIQAEQCLKENLEDTLQLEIEGCKEEIGETLNDQPVFKSLISCRVCICVLTATFLNDLPFLLFVFPHLSFRHPGRYDQQFEQAHFSCLHVCALMT